MTPIFEYLIAAALVLGGVFGLIGSYGLIKLNDPMSRLHAPTKATTLGVGGVLIASMIHAIVSEGHVSWHELLITLFLFLTAPITANFIAKAHIHRHETPESLPPAGKDRIWATHDTRPEDQPAAPPAPGSPH
ncbi:MAG: Na+/H+ antiporter subunit G [Pseudodonghicola sp.]|jgi:multicomponent K+:H+ antiporter subunit G